MKNLAFARLGEEMTHIEELIGKGKNQRHHGGGGDRIRAPPMPPRMRRVHLRLLPVLQAELKRVHGRKTAR